MRRVGVLAFHGDVSEHIAALHVAAHTIGIQLHIVEVRSRYDLAGLDGLVLPGGESPILMKLCEREHMVNDIKKVPALFGTCAGAILLAKHIDRGAERQRTFGLMDITIERNAYGRQVDSFETLLRTELGTTRGVFIRAPRITKHGTNVRVLARHNESVVACEETQNGRYVLALTFHPELTGTKFHEHFLAELPQ